MILDIGPDNGLYNFKIFTPIYISRFGLVKLFKIDYTVLDSSFSIHDAEVIDDGYATFKLKNTGTKDLLIKTVQVNGVNYVFSMGKGAATNVVEDSDTDSVWVDLNGASLQKDDVVKITVTAESEAQEGRLYEFSNSTTNFFVRESEQGEIKINKEHSMVLQKDTSTNDIFLEVKNTGETVEKLDRFYLNEDTIENELNPNNIQYLSGSSILEPGDIVTLQITDVDANFFPIRNYNKIGVVTPSGVSSEILFTSSKENYSISILSQERILSPEVLAALSSTYRNHIPINFNKTHAITFVNGSTIIKVNIKNTGDIIFGIDSVYLTESLIEVDFEDFYTESGSLNLDVNEEDYIVVDATDYIDSVDNEEIVICVTGSFGTTVTSDIGYIHMIKDQADLKIIEYVHGVTTSFIYANETGNLLIKNIGNQQITLDEVYLNSTLASNITYLYGNSSLDVQECAIIQFDIPGLTINKSDDVIINVTTTSSAKTGEIFSAYVDPLYYNIEIDDPGTTVLNSGNMTISFTNIGQINVTLTSIYINNTFISLPNLYTYFNDSWVPLSSSFMDAFNIDIGDSMEITVRTNDLETIIGTTINVDDEVVILIRTEIY
ncbi:MAG: hypothetical protein ACW990_05880 [Promethearchaeota archaeon]|jgi:hypothetical protein